MSLMCTGGSPGRHPFPFRATRRLGAAGAAFACFLAVCATTFALQPTGQAPSPPVEPQAYQTSLFGIATGMPTDVALGIVQTRDGYLWIATEVGLVRFDGMHMTVFRSVTSPGLASNLARCLLEDEAGTLWIGTQKGLSKYSNGKFEELPGINAAVGDLAPDGWGGIWIGTLGAGLLNYRDGRLTSHSADPGHPASLQILRMLHDSSGRLWMAFRDKGLASYANGSYRTEAWADAKVGEIGRLGEGPAGTIWVGTNQGAIRLRDGKPQLLGPEQGLLAGEQATAFYTDRDGNFWVAARLLFRADSPEADKFTQVAVPGVDLCRTFMQDREGDYWIGTSGAGIVRMKQTPFRAYPAENESVRAVAEGANGAVWAVMSRRGVVEIDRDGKQTPVPLRPDERPNAWSVLLDSSQRLWIGTLRTLLLVDHGEIHRYPLPEARTIYQDRQGDIWLGLMGRGTYRYRNGAFEPMEGAIGAGRVIARAFAEDPAGTLYIGNDTGITAFRDGKGTQLNPNTKTPDLEVRALYPDADGDLWVGTKQYGLLLYRQGVWHAMTGIGDVMGEQITVIQEDGAGRLWLGTARGVVWGKKSDFIDVEFGAQPGNRFHVVDRNEGIEPSAVGVGTQPAGFKARDGSIWFAGRAAVISVRPERVAFNAVVPPVQIEHVRVDGIPVDSAAPITLPAGTRSVVIEYTALSFVEPADVRFRYRLEGRDTEWTDAQTRRTAFFTDLRPGHYRFQVAASNNDGVWNDTGASIVFVQSPWFYQTWWFYGLAGLAVAALTGGLHWRHTAVLRTENERLERRITERTRKLVESEAALRSSQEKFSKAFYTQPDAITITRLADSTYLEVNASFTHIIGYSAAEAVGRTPLPGDLDIWKNPQDRDRFIAALREHGEVSGFETQFRRKNGSILNGLTSARIMRIGGEDCILSITRDVTGQKQLEDQLQHAQKMEAVGQLAGGVAHDYNNILTSTLMQLGLLLEDTSLSEEVRNALLELEKDANRAGSLTRQLLTFSRRQVIQVRSVELNGMLENLFKMLRRLLGETIHLEFRPSSVPVGIEADVGMIEQVVTNLCVNARDALGPKGGRLQIETSVRTLEERDVRSNPEARCGTFACLSVTDDGSGMDSITQKHLFEPFFTTKEFGKGTGLGLAIIYGIVKQHQGWIEVESEVGRGSTFRVFLPHLAILAPEAAGPAIALAGCGRETILLVEDEEAVRNTVRRALERCGYHIVEACDGEDAIRQWGSGNGKIDLLLSDMVMPKGITGLELAERFRRDRPALRVIVTSGYSVDLRKAGVPHGAGTAYLPKPYQLATLASTIRRCLDDN